MSERIRVAAAEQVPTGEALRVVVAGVPIALFHVGEEFFAINDTCSHAEASLSEGEVSDHEVTCPKHGSRFDLRTGRPKGLPAYRPVQVYPIEVSDGALYITWEG